MGNCWSKSMNPPHHGSTLSSRPSMERSLPSSQDPVHLSSAPMEPSLPTSRDPVPASPPMRNCCSRFQFSGSRDPVPGSTSSSHPSMEQSVPASQDPVRPPSVEASSSLDLVSPSPPMDSIDSVREKFEKRDKDELVELIGPLVNFIENQLQKMNTKSEAGSSSSAGWLTTLEDATTLAATVVDTISKEAENLSKSEIMKGMGNLTLKVMKGLGELHWVFIGLSVAAYAVESYNKVGSTKDDCLELLQNILEVAKDVKQFREQMLKILQLEKDFNMSDQKEKLCKAVGAIMEGAVVCCEYLNKGQLSRLFSATTVAAQLENTNKKLTQARDSLSFSMQRQIYKQLTLRLPQSPLQLLDFQPVGIDKAVGEVKDLLDMEGVQSALAVVVCGFGGVGKSTLAGSVVQSLNWSSNFKFCRAEIDETKTDKTTHIKELQQQIIYDLGGVKVDLRNPGEGQSRIKDALKQKCSLLFIDNVVSKDYRRDLLPKDLSIGKQELKSDAEKHKTKLRILITSRQKNVVEELNNIMCKEYEVKTLSESTSKDLLFKTIVQSQVVEDMDSEEKCLTEKIAAACKGVPLLLSVFGKHLGLERVKHLIRERNKNTYVEALEDALKVLSLSEGSLHYGDEDLGTKLMFMYDKIMDVEVKEAFLDICTYFRGWEWDVVADIVDSPKLEDLRSRMLLSKSGSGMVVVHDILLLMGKKKAGLTRFSNDIELSDALENNFDGFGEVRGISVVNDNSLVTIQSTQLEAMRQSLRVLILGDWVTLDGPPCRKAFTKLRYLHVGDITAFPFKDPSKLNNLRVFLNRSQPGMNLSKLPSSLKRISHEVQHFECDKFVEQPFKNLSSLKTFIVRPQKSVELPQELSLPSSLVTLELNRCKNVPKDMGRLTVLESLILDGSDMERLPQGFGQLVKLKHLSMNNCSKLAFLSDELGKLSSLEELSIEDCGNLTALPDSLGELTSLQTLKLRESTNLQQLPESFGKLLIQSLELHSLVNLHKLPNSFGKMLHLKDLSLISCYSLASLPNSFVQLEMLETLTIIKCTKLRDLPKDFDRLRCLKDVTVKECYLLKELPHGFGALPALKTLELANCDSFMNLPSDFSDLKCLEQLLLGNLPSMSRMPAGLGKLKKLRVLFISYCFQLKTLSDDFENMASLERLQIRQCPEVDEAMMEKIIKLHNCCLAEIQGSRKLLEKWEDMQGETERPLYVVSGDYERNMEARKRAIRFALLNGKCMEVNDKVMERSSLLEGLEEGRSTTVALIMLPIQTLQQHQHQTLQRFVDMASETAEENGSGRLQIVCARKVDLHTERPTPTDEEGDILQILPSLPTGSCFIPSSESKRLKILTSCCDSEYYYASSLMEKLNLVMVNVGIDVEGCKSFENVRYISDSEILGNIVMEPPPSEIMKPEDKDNNSIQCFIKSICPENVCETDGQSQSQAVAGQNKTREFIEALKHNGINYLFTNNNTSTAVVDDLYGKVIGFFICHFKFLGCINLQEIYEHLQQKDFNFITIWIPTARPEEYGLGTYTRLIHGMPWATFRHPQLVNVENRDPCFVVLDKHGQITNHDALPLLMGWGVDSYPFTRHNIPKSFSWVESESCLEFLLHGMNIVGRKPMRRKMTFLFAGHPRECLKMKSTLEQLTKTSGSFEVMYVGKFCEEDIYNVDYEEATQNMHWPSLSFSDMIMFWYRCKYLASKEVYEEANIMMEILHGLAKFLCATLVTDTGRGWLVLVDNDGAVTCGGYEVLQMISDSCDEISGEVMEMKMVKEELMKSLSRGECSPLVKTFFRDEIDNHPQHPQHCIISRSRVYGVYGYWCDVCGGGRSGYDGRRYKCEECDWDMCGRCWMAYAKQQVEPLLRGKDD